MVPPQFKMNALSGGNHTSFVTRSSEKAPRVFWLYNKTKTTQSPNITTPRNKSKWQSSSEANEGKHEKLNQMFIAYT